MDCRKCGMPFNEDELCAKCDGCSNCCTCYSDDSEEDGHLDSDEDI